MGSTDLSRWSISSNVELRREFVSLHVKVAEHSIHYLSGGSAGMGGLEIPVDVCTPYKPSTHEFMVALYRSFSEKSGQPGNDIFHHRKTDAGVGYHTSEAEVGRKSFDLLTVRTQQPRLFCGVHSSIGQRWNLEWKQKVWKEMEGKLRLLVATSTHVGYPFVSSIFMYVRVRWWVWYCTYKEMYPYIPVTTGTQTQLEKSGGSCHIPARSPLVCPLLLQLSNSHGMSQSWVWDLPRLDCVHTLL